VIHWRFGGWDDSSLPDRTAAESWLCAEERERLGAFRIDKRREDWLIGRVNAKALVADAIEHRYGVRLKAGSIHIDRLPSGAPKVVVRDATASASLPATLPLCLSNSHSAGHALCGAVWTDGFEAGRTVLSVGVDLEWIEPRSDAFVADFLTAPERDWVASGDRAERHRRANTAWSAKEAVLKVVQRGLTVDTYWLTCVPSADTHDWLTSMLTPTGGDRHAGAEAPACSRQHWSPLDVTCDQRFPTHGLTFRAAWREMAGFVATVAVGCT
jgi:phosphopantetheinyl transferase